jgi:very-short-patch-repair endonuclease
VEVDGPIHDHQADQDAARDAFLRSQGVSILRVCSEDVLERMPGVIDRIRMACSK